MKHIALIGIILLLTFNVVAAGNSQASLGNPFSAVEDFVETLEVGIAGIVGGPDLKAKAMANNAQESLREAESLKERNKTDKAEKKTRRYAKMINRSREVAGKSNDEDLGRQIDEISEQNRETLRKLKRKTPDAANKGLDNAINSLAQGKPEEDIRNPSELDQRFSESEREDGSESDIAPGKPETLNETVDQETGPEDDVPDQVENTSEKLKEEVAEVENETEDLVSNTEDSLDADESETGQSESEDKEENLGEVTDSTELP